MHLKSGPVDDLHPAQLLLSVTGLVHDKALLRQQVPVKLLVFLDAPILVDATDFCQGTFGSISTALRADDMCALLRVEIEFTGPVRSRSSMSTARCRAYYIADCPYDNGTTRAHGHSRTWRYSDCAGMPAR